MLRRSFLKLIGAVAGVMGFGGGGVAQAAEPELSLAELLAQGNTAEGSDICMDCVERDKDCRLPQGYAAESEDDLWKEWNCWIDGHEDEHDRAINTQRARCRDQWAAARTKASEIRPPWGGCGLNPPCEHFTRVKET